MNRMTAKKYFTITSVSLANAINYRASVISGFLSFSLLIYVFMGLWRVIYRDGGIEGYGYAQMVWYLIVAELVGYFASGTSVFSQMNDDIKSGSIAYLLGRPVNYVAYQLATAAGHIIFNLAAFGALGVALGFIFAGPPPGFTLVHLPAMLLSAALGILLSFSFRMLIGLSAFVIEDNNAIYWIFSKLTLMLGTLLPVEFLPGWLQPVAKALPFSYISWAPARLFVDFSWERFAALIPMQAMWAAVIFCLTLLGCRAAMRGLQVNGG